MKIVAIIQARMGSTRLPGKVMADIGGRPLLAHLIERLRYVPAIDLVVVATSIQPRDKIIEDLATRLGVPTYRGSEQDVLSRYVEAAQLYEADVILRVTADEPFIDPEVIQQVLKKHLESRADYTCNNQPLTFPDGITIEIISFASLMKAHELGKHPHDREHVTFYIWNHPEQFKIQKVEAHGPLRRPDLRYCVDRAEDLEVARAIDRHLGWLIPYFTLKQVIQFLDQNPQVRRINRDVKNKVVTY